jgi:hypothetical protein
VKIAKNGYTIKISLNYNKFKSTKSISLIFYQIEMLTLRILSMLLKTPKQSQVQHKLKHFKICNKNLNKSCAKNKLFSKNKIAMQLLEIENYLNIYV